MSHNLRDYKHGLLNQTSREENLEARTYYYERRIDDFKSWLKVEVQKNPSFASVAQKVTELFPVVKNG